MGQLDFVQDLAVVTFCAGIGGFLCQKIGLSSVVGFMVAGLLVGPHTPFISIVVDENGIETLSQLGLVFLMFSIGLDLSVAKLRRMGIGIILAVALGGALVFNVVRSICPFLGLGSSESLFVGGMLVASSSAIIGKILPETGLIHQRAGNLAMSITVLEDLVAVVVLTFISSVAQIHRGPAVNVGKILGVLLVFVTVVVVLGLLLLPRVLQRLNRAGTDLLTVTVAGLVLGIAVISVRTGYSLALGAFLLGAIVAETPQRPTVERAMQGMRDVFIAVFFVSIGMLLDPALLVKNGALIFSLGLIAVVVRTLAVSASLLITGTSDRDAFRAGLMVTPIGEFAFIIAQIGVSAGMLSSDYYPIAVGIALFTALVSPVLIRHSGRISDVWLKCQPKFFYDLLKLYHDFLASVGEHQRRSRVFGLARQSLPPLLIGLTFASGILVIAPFLFSQWSRLFPTNAGRWRDHLFWALVGVVATGPLLGVWRRFAEFLKGLVEIVFGAGFRAQRPVLVLGLELIAAFLLFVWIWLLTPVIGAPASFYGAILGTAAVYALFFGKRLKTMQRRIASELAEAILSPEDRRKRSHDDWLKDHQEWDFSLSEIRVPDSAAWFGKSLGDLSLRSQFGCSVVGVERQGYPLPSPGPDSELFPGDVLLVLGTTAQIQNVRAFFDSAPNRTEQADLLDEIRLESIEVPEKSRLAGNALAELDIPRNTGVQIVGVARADHRMLFPGPFQVLEVADWLLVVGTRDQILHFREWIKEIESDQEKKWEIGI
jgi:monovalent cation:H+ antiporter-2, CPA2 family